MSPALFRTYPGIDLFRLVAAFLIVAIHTSPLSSFSEPLDFFFTRVISRVGVPFFLMVTGFFVLSRYINFKEADSQPLWQMVRKTAIIYGIAVVVYLPVNFYAGHFTSGNSRASFLQALFFDGTFYHLWYLPAVILGAILLYLLLRKLPLLWVTTLTGLLYLVGLLGDSYYGLAVQIPGLESFYAGIFSGFSYTRNGLFYAPAFLLIGAILGARQSKFSQQESLRGFLLSLGFLLGEGALLHSLGWQRHDSMYLTLIPVMFFLFQFLETFSEPSSGNQEEFAALRPISLFIYLVHPLVIIGVRGIAKFTKTTALFVDQSFLHYLLVCGVSTVFAVLLTWWLQQRRKPQQFRKGRAWAEISLENLRYNVAALQDRLAPGSQLMPVLKADAYGHGAVVLGRELNHLGLHFFCVATVKEAVELRENGIKGDILILGYTHPEEFPLLRQYELIQTIVDYDYGKALHEYGKPVRVHVKIDTGMNRLGERFENRDCILQLFQLEHLQIEGLYTHLCVADSSKSEDRVFTQLQISRFYETAQWIEEQDLGPIKLHIQSSYGLINYPDLPCDYVRVGIALYGVLDPELMLQEPLQLRPMLSIKARVELTKWVKQDEGIGYGLEYLAEQDMRIAVISIGYSDGVPRRLSHKVGRVLLAEQEAPIIGFVCMDQLLADVSQIPGVQSGDTAVLIGESGSQEITTVEVAQKARTIPNEILSCLGSRLEKVYTE